MAGRFCGPLFVAAAGHPQGFRKISQGFRKLPARFRKVSAKFLFWRCFLEIIRKNRKKEGVGGQISIIFPVLGPILEIYGKNHAVRCL